MSWFLGWFAAGVALAALADLACRARTLNRRTQQEHPS